VAAALDRFGGQFGEPALDSKPNPEAEAWSIVVVGRETSGTRCATATRLRCTRPCPAMSTREVPAAAPSVETMGAPGRVRRAGSGVPGMAGRRRAIPGIPRPLPLRDPRSAEGARCTPARLDRPRSRRRVVAPGSRRRCDAVRTTSGQVRRASALRGLPATTGVVRRFPADARARSARDARKAGGRAARKDCDLQVFLRERRDSNPRPPA
jgi:hypothetical protein